MWLKKLKRKKLPFLLAGVILLVAALIFPASLGFAVEANRFGTEYYSREGLPNLIYTSGETWVPEAIRQAAPNEVTGVSEGYQMMGPIDFEGEKITGIFQVIPLPDYTEIPWDTTPKEGDTASKGPNPGEIWLPRVWADIKGVQAGDTLTLQGGRRFTVSTLYDSYLIPSTMISLFMFYVHPNDFAKLPEMIPCNITALYTDGDIDALKETIAPYIQGARSLVSLDRALFIESLTMISLILGGIGILSAVMIFIVAVVVIRFMLRANLMKEYRSIGIYKSQGFPNRAIRGFYLNSYAVVGGFSIALGALAGVPVAAALSRMGMKYAGGFSVTPTLFALAAVAFALLLAALVLNVFFATRPIKKITPVDALRIGVTSTKAKFKRAWVKNASSPFAMAVNDIGKHKGYSFMIVLILSVSFYLVLFFLSTRVTVNTMNKHIDTWFGFPQGDVFVTGRITDDLIRHTREHPDVERVVVLEELLKTPLTLDIMYDSTVKLSPLVFDDFSSMPYTEGRGPKEANETAINQIALARLGLRVGDYISLSLGSEFAPFLITGSYGSMMQNGHSLQLLSDALPAHGADFAPGILVAFLKDGASPDILAQEWTDAFKGIDASEEMDMMIDTIKGVEDMIAPVTLVSIIVFIVFSLLNIVNLIIQNHADNRRQYGILKALGFSSGYITARSAWRIMLLSGVAAAVSLLLHLLLSARLFTLAILDALSLAIPETLLMLGVLLTVLMLVTLLFCLPVKKITPRELMEE